MRILIINPPFYRLQRQSLLHYPPSCCYIAATLEKAGFESWIYNADYAPDKKTILGNTNHLNIKALIELAQEYERRLNDDNDLIWQEVVDQLFKFQPEILIISVFNTTLTAGIKIARLAKQINPSVLTIFEGSTNRGLHSAIDPARCGDFSVMDFAVRREPELTMVELVRAIADEVTDFSHIRGLSWKKYNGHVLHNEDRPFLDDLDLLPFPARHRLLGYTQMPSHAFQGIYGSRGCPFECIFCGGHTSGGYQPRLRSAKNMVDEIEYVYKHYKTRYFYICDDIFFIDTRRAKEFCQLLIKRRLPIYWSAQTRAEMVDDTVLALMKKSGGQHVAVGVEVGSPYIRDLIKKGNTVDDVRRCAKLIKKHGLYLVAFCIIGLPWEGREEIEDTVNLIKEIEPYIIYPYLPTPAEGTELADILIQKNSAGLVQYRDRFHIDPSSILSEKLSPGKKEAVIEWAMQEFARINRKNLLNDIIKRPRFYSALAGDMGFLRNPYLFFSYLKDYFVP